MNVRLFQHLIINGVVLLCCTMWGHINCYYIPQAQAFIVPILYPEGWFHGVTGFIVPMMSDNDVKLLTKYYSKASVYFEWGSGTSTIYASQIIPKIYSVESDYPFHRIVMSLIPQNRDVTYLTVDLHGTKNLGYPKGATWQEIHNYYTAYKKEYNADLILIDGRFRVACGLHLLDKIDNNTIVMAHDFPNRQEYFILKNYYELIETGDILTIMKKKHCCPTEEEFGRYHNQAF